MSEDVLLTEQDGAVTVLTLNRPRTRNALNSALIEALGAAVQAAGEDPKVRVLVITGAGGAFCSGADLKAGVTDGADFFERIDGMLDRYHAIIRSIVGANDCLEGIAAWMQKREPAFQGK